MAHEGNNALMRLLIVNSTESALVKLGRGGKNMSATRLEKQVEKLEAELKEKKAKMAREKRKERGGQLVALGIVLESAFRRMGPAEKSKVQGWAEQLDPRNKLRAQAAFARLLSEAKPPEETATAQQPQSLTAVSAHLQDRMIER